MIDISILLEKKQRKFLALLFLLDAINVLSHYFAMCFWPF